MTFSKRNRAYVILRSCWPMKVDTNRGLWRRNAEQGRFEEVREAFLLEAEANEVRWVAEEVGRVNRLKRAGRKRTLANQGRQDFLFYTESATPPFLNQLGFEESFHYLYAKDGFTPSLFLI